MRRVPIATTTSNKRRKTKLNTKKGFTLIEIMIVVAIIAILAAIAIPNFMEYRRTSQENACAANIKTLNTATEAWRVKTNAKNDAEPRETDLVSTDGTGFLKAWPSCPISKEKYSTYVAGTTNSWVCTHEAKTSN